MSMRGTAAAVLALAVWAALSTAAPPAVALPGGFTETVAIDGLSQPIDIEFSPGDGRVFVAEKRGVIKVFDDLDDPTATVFADLRTNVYNFWDRGLLGMTLHPDFPSDPRVYVLYTFDADIGGTPPKYGTPGGSSDPCPNPPGATSDGCVVSGRLSVLEATGDTAGPEDVLIEDWCQQYPSHSVGDLAFGADGALYATAGDGASFTFTDYGQRGAPENPCGDPPAPVGGDQSPPDAEGGALRSQDVRTPGDPTGLDGTVIRIDPDTGAALPDNPAFGSGDANTDRIVAHGLRNPFRMAVRPGTSEVWLGDVGWNSFEEINRVDDPTGGVTNFGWPCYEGPNRQGGYDGQDLALCEDLYDEGPAAHDTPYFAYRHGDEFVDGDGCGAGGSSAAGVAFSPAGGGFPDTYDGALFYADYSRDCIWVLPAGADGLPDPAQRAVFLPTAQNPVDLEFGPGGDLFYVDFRGTGAVRRISYTAGDQPPTADIVADVTAGDAPLTVTFDAGGSTDPEGGPLTYAWDLDGDGVHLDASGVTATATYAEPGTTTVGLVVTDVGGLTASASIDITADDTAPTVSIDNPDAETTWAVGEELAFSGSATDAQDGAVTDLSWEVLLHHCVTPDDCHVHAVETLAGTTGSFVAPDHDYPSWIELRVTATDSGGLTDTASVRLDPRTIELTAATDPPGLAVTLGDATAAAPLTREVIVGSLNSVAAPASQTAGGTTYTFDAWSDGGARSHLVTAPASDTTVTAAYTTDPAPDTGLDTRDIGDPALAGSTTVDGGVHTIEAGGRDIWGASDQFHYASRALDGDGMLTARVVSQTDPHGWAKAGVMVRDGLGASAAHAMMVLTPGNGTAFQWRPSAGATSGHRPGPDADPPQWVRIEREGDVLRGATSPDGTDWTPVGSTTIAMGADVRIGLAVTSHHVGETSTAVFDDVTFGDLPDDPGPEPVDCAADEWTATFWANRTLSGDPALHRCDVAIANDWGTGSPDPAVGADDFSARWTRTATFDGTYTFTARSDDGIRVWVDDDLVIEDWSDHAARTRSATRALTGDHEVRVEYYEHAGRAVAEVDWALDAPDPEPQPDPVVCDTDEWTATFWPNRDLTGDPALQRCDTAVDFAWGSDAPDPAVPADRFSARWTRTVDFAPGGYTFTTRSDDGIRLWVDDDLLVEDWSNHSPRTWTATRTLSGTHDVRVEYYENHGGAVAEVDWTLDTPQPEPEPEPEPEPVTLTGSDIGLPAIAGSTTATADGVTLVGGGRDIWGRADQFHYAWTELTGDGTITARVDSLIDTHEWAKAGVMVRGGPDADAVHAMTVVTPGNGTAFQRRATVGGATKHVPGPAWEAPAWVRVERSGDLLTGSVSADGVTWVPVGERVLPLPATAHVGLVVTSHDDATTTTATFADVTITVP